ncbi:sigma-E factor negative regulatory protein [Pseudoalteromonas aurantia]|uniref:Sigma-E factor negative regulatory protein RseA n=1 Tax=Pseudoalteromonas aurantia 208 TaxID=1314867 RepID=A0ABR9EEM8_9GAMM|nr:anti sigma-E factor RseA C-terminal domain-containing protein [Pseudoalteromonas aurantia]MBE0368854.1 sigma-E factor negative regulatory protein RseA [Pseudoalteromonas aurantia 208]
MTKANHTASRQEVASRVLDGDLPSNELSVAQLDTEKFVRYAQIGDVMRERQGGLNIDITASVAAALESEPCHSVPVGAQVDVQDNGTKVIKLSAWQKPLSQMAIAASVALVAIVGVNTMPQPSGEDTDNLPVFQSTPLAGGVSPVSFSSEQPALESAEKGLRELQQQRIGALVLEHQRQSRVAYSLQKQTQRADEQPEEKK